MYTCGELSDYQKSKHWIRGELSGALNEILILPLYEDYHEITHSWQAHWNSCKASQWAAVTHCIGSPLLDRGFPVFVFVFLLIRAV